MAALSAVLMERLPQLAEDVTERICREVDAYHGDGPVPRDDLLRSCRENLEFGFRSLAAAGPHDLSAPRRTGRRRAAQGAPLAMVLSAYRIGLTSMWDLMVTEAERTALVSDAALVRIASDVWTLAEMFTTEMMSSYRDVLTEQSLRRDQERSALVEAVLRGGTTDTATVWEAADLLGLPYRGYSWRWPPRRRHWPDRRCPTSRVGCAITASDPRGGCCPTCTWVWCRFARAGRWHVWWTAWLPSSPPVSG